MTSTPITEPMDATDDTNGANPMLYDPLQDVNIGETSKIRQFMAATVVAMAAVSVGTVMAWTSPVMPQLRTENSTMKVTSVEESWVGSLLAIGAIFGAIPAGFLADKLGRKYTSMLLSVPFFITWVLTVAAFDVTWLYFARIFAGIGTGAACVVAPMYISEIGETSIRGALGSFFQLFISVGILLVYVIGDNVTWRILSVICAMPPILLLFGMIYLPESPTYLMKIDRRDEAVISLRFLWGHKCNSKAAIHLLQSDLDESTGTAAIFDLVRIRGNRFALIICLCLMMFQQLSGINAIIFYTMAIFKSAGSSLDPSICTIIVGVVQVIMTFGSTLLIDKAGRRILLLQSSVVMGICLAIVGLFYHLKDGGSDVSSIGWLPLLSVVLFIVCFSLGFGPIPWMMMGELFAPDVKGIASSIAVMFNWTLVFIVTKSFGPMNEELGQDVTFWIFAGCMAIATLFVAIVVPETKGKSNSQIQAILNKGR